MTNTFAIYAPENLQACLTWSVERLVPVEVMQLVDDVRAGVRARRIKGVIVFRVTDLADSAQQFASLLAEWRGIPLVSVGEGIDTRVETAVGGAQALALRAFSMFTRKPQAEGQKKAKAAGVKLGRKAEEQTAEQEAAVRAHFAQHGTMKPRELGRVLGINHALAGRWLKKVADAVVVPPAEVAPEIVMTLNPNTEAAA